ncbi:sulfate adenylyltransferase [Candidatus Bathyarchaeota archaeon RBG_13_60_20]|nr:MAG: sulfate adenylyltransferase [Candidatus Bathyarchaeota archaeon RBG_13_60_20]
MPRPHGGRLVERLTAPDRVEKAAEEASELTVVQVSEELRLDLENVAFGLYSPLAGPLNQGDYLTVLAKGRLACDLPWTIPILLDLTEEEASGFSVGDRLALAQDGERFAVLDVQEKYGWDRKTHCERVYRTLDPAHPGVAKTHEMRPALVGGCIEVFNPSPGKYPRYRLKPRETRFLFREKGWRTVAGFQTRNAPHIGHEYVQKTALAFVDGLFINPLIGRKKPGDFTDEVILETYEAAFRHYFLRNSATMVTLEMEMRYAGPREAIHHAIVRKNYGCSHFIVGRDHAGVGSYYGPFEAQEIFEDYPDLGVTPIFFRNFFHCNRCGGPQNDKICPHGPEDHVNYSGTKMRSLLLEGKRPDETMMRPEVVDVILRHKEPFNP